MKRFIFTLTFILAPISANAGQILPNLYAQKFCEYRSLGISVDDSRTAAIDDAYISSGNPVMVNFQGKMVSSDVIQSVIDVSKLCPKFLK